MERRLLEHRPEFDAFASHELASDRKAARMADHELQQAAELLERVEEGGLNGYLVELIDRAGAPASRPVTQALAGMLGRAARRLLQRDGTFASTAAGRVFGLELEGLSAEDQVFEVARHFVRFAAEAARRARSTADSASPHTAARHAATAAAQAMAPGLLPRAAPSRWSSGTWIRRAHDIIVLNP